VSTAIPNAGVLCYTPDIYDTNRNDNSPANASTIIPNGLSQFHNYCNPLRADFQQDEDWVRMDVIQGERYFIHSITNSLPTVTEISLFADDGTTLIAKSSPPGFGSNTFLMWTPDHDQTVYLRLRHLDGRVIGTQVSSTVVVKTGFISFIPIINK
jgi:hypothetical protein